MVLWNYMVCRICADLAIPQRIFALFGQLYNFCRPGFKILFIVQGMSIMEVMGNLYKNCLPQHNCGRPCRRVSQPLV